MSISVSDYRGTWKHHDYYVVSSEEEADDLFYAPTLNIAMRLRRDLADRVRAGELTDAIDTRLAHRSARATDPRERPADGFHLALGLNRDCTLRCGYCHAEADKAQIADEDVLSTGVTFALERAGKTRSRSLSVSFAVGGEPTMHWPLFQRMVTRLRDSDVSSRYGVQRVSLSMTTNGYYGIGHREFIGRTFDGVTVSLDGPADVHDQHRPDTAGGGSYQRVAESIRYFRRQHSLQTSIRSTVSSLSVMRLPEIVEHFHEQFGGDLLVAFEPLVPIGRARELEGYAPPDHEAFARGFWSARLRGRELGVRVIGSGANVDRLVTQFCGAMAIPSFTVCVDGTITACHRDQNGSDYGYGSIQGREVVIDEARVAANVRAAEMPESCRGCFLRWHCAGDCPDVRRFDAVRCDVNRYLGFKMIREKLDSVQHRQPGCCGGACDSPRAPDKPASGE